MGYCVNHPDRETAYRCTKHALYLCEQCLQCRDPKIYCRFREACVIHFMTQNNTLETLHPAFPSPTQGPNASNADEEPTT